MAKKNQSSKPKITQKKLQAYHDNKVMGKSAKQIAKETGQCPRQVEYDIGDVAHYIQGSDEFKEAVKNIVKMIPKSMAVFKNHLTNKLSYGMKGNPDLAAATTIAEGTGLLSKRTIVDANINFSNMSSDELAKFINSAVENATARPE